MNQELQESTIKASIKRGIQRFLSKIKQMHKSESQNELGHDKSSLKCAKALPKVFKTLSELKMDKLDLEIQKQIEEAIVKEKRANVGLFKSESIHIIPKPKLKIQSKIKAIREIDPEFLTNFKRKTESPFKEDIQTILSQVRSISTLNYSPTDSRITPSISQNCNRSSYYENLKKSKRSEDFCSNREPEESSNFSSFAKEFVKNGMQMEKQLRNAFRTKIQVNPANLFNRSLKKT